MFQPDLNRGDTPMSDELLKSVRKKRFVHIAEPESDDAMFLDFYNANAVAGKWEGNTNSNNMDAITIKPDARKIEILEEFLHGTQAKIGMTGSTLDIRILEIHVKDFMIRHKDLLGLSNKDVQALVKMMESYE